MDLLDLLAEYPGPCPLALHQEAELSPFKYIFSPGRSSSPWVELCNCMSLKDDDKTEIQGTSASDWGLGRKAGFRDAL